MSDRDSEKVSGVDQPQEAGPWDLVLPTLGEWEPAWAATCVKMTTNPWTAGVLPRKFIELVSVALNAACTNLNPDGTRRHIRAALKAGATREEVLFVLKSGALMSIHSCSLGAPILWVWGYGLFAVYDLIDWLITYAVGVGEMIISPRFLGSITVSILISKNSL